MRKVYLLLTLAALSCSPARAQLSSSGILDSISQSLTRQLAQGSPTPLQRVFLVRQQLVEAMLDQQVRRIPLLLDYLARTVPDSVPTVQPREAMSLLLAAGAFRPLLQRVRADKADQEQRRYRKQPLLPPDVLADIADYYLAEHVESLTAQTQRLTNEEATFIRLLLDILPRGGVSPDVEIRIKIFLKQYPGSLYGSILNKFQVREQVKASLRVWHERREKEMWEEIRQRQQLQSPQKWELFSFHHDTPNYTSSQLRLGSEFYYGNAAFSGGLGELFQPHFNIGAGLNIGWKRYVFHLCEAFGSAGVKRDFAYLGDTWTSGTKLKYYLIEASVGYHLLHGKGVTLSPFFGASISHFSIPNNNLNSKLDLYLSRPLTAGLELDLLLGKQEAYSSISLLLKIRGGVRSGITPIYPEIPGALFFLSIGLGVDRISP